jgi:hypothetical protein
MLHLQYFFSVSTIAVDYIENRKFLELLFDHSVQ